MNYKIVCILNGVLDWDRESYDVLLAFLLMKEPHTWLGGEHFPSWYICEDIGVCGREKAMANIICNIFNLLVSHLSYFVAVGPEFSF